MTEEQFDELIKQVREEEAPGEQVDAARERVWRHISAGSVACAEFRPEFSAYLAGQLSESRRLLVDDHLGRCAECRTALAEVKGERKVVTMPQVRYSRHYGWARWAIAAGGVLGVLYVSSDRIDSALAPSVPHATVVAVSGALYRLPQTSLQPGSTLSGRDAVRTTAGSRAILQLADGSRVELNQRTELSVQSAWSGQTIQLDRGDIIVQASKQRRGHLRVVTRDSVAAVKGTVFAVSSGSAGSLVSVVEGSVAVSQPGAQRLLTAGKQAATSPSLDRVKVRQAISWSQDVEKYYGLLAELIGIEKQLSLTAPALRTEARLLRYVPSSAMVYFAIPNLDGTIRQALRLVDQRARENAALNEWWSSEQGQEWKKTLDRVQAITPLLGEEVVFVLTKDPARRHGQVPFVLAQIQPGRQDALREGIERIVGDRSEKLPYRITQDLLMISDDASHLAMLGAQTGGALSPFGAEISRRYRNGVGWLLGLDLASYTPWIVPGEADGLFGLLNTRYLFFEQRSGGGREENEATLSFKGSRTGIASWLAPPGAAGSAEYVSNEAVTAFSASTRDPRQALDEILSAASGIAADVRRFESATGVSLSGDIGASLGTDFTFAIERPSLPIPGWIAALEVVRPAVLDDAVRRLVEAYNRQTPPERADRKVILTQENVNGRTWTSLKMGQFPATLYWTHDHGYLIASMDRALGARAIAIRESGSSLIRSAVFQQLFPTTSGLHHSGFFWLNTSGVLSQLAGLVESPTLKSLMSSREPLLVVLDGETEQIRAASRNRLTSLILDTMLVIPQPQSSPRGMHSPQGKRDIIGKVLHDTRH